MRWHAPLDPDCPDVIDFHEGMAMDPMNYSIPSDVLADITLNFESKHRAKCKRCQEYGAANVEVAE